MSHEGDQEVEIESIGRSIEAAPDSQRFQLLARRAKAYRIKGDVRAVKDYVDIVNGSSDQNLICHSQAMLALISIEALELKEALWWAMSALNTNENQFDGNLAAGLALDAIELHKVAIHYFQRALTIDDCSEIAGLKLAISYRESMRFSEADKAFRTLIARSPDNPKFNYEYGWNWQLRHDIDNHFEHAIECYEKALRCNPNEELKGRIERKLNAIAP